MNPFPVLEEPGEEDAPRYIPWELAERAYDKYVQRFGDSQSLTLLARRGGFAASELDRFVPGWREELDEPE